MINKIKLITASALVMMFSTVSSYAIDSYAVGVTASWGAFEASGTETVGTAKQSEAGEMETAFGSLFIEADVGMATIGIDYIPMEVESETVTGTRVEDEGGSTSTVTNTAYVEIYDHFTLYAIVPFADSGLFARLGYSTMEVDTKENLGTGGAYGNFSLEGVHIGVGYEMDTSSDVFVRASLDYHDYDDTGLTNQNNSAVSVTADLDGYSGSLSVGRRF